MIICPGAPKKIKRYLDVYFLLYFILLIFIFCRTKSRITSRSTRQNLMSEYPKGYGGETVYDKECEPVEFFPNAPQFTFDSCSFLAPISLERRMLWNFVCGAAFHYAASPQPFLLYPREVGLKIQLQDKMQYIPIWKFKRIPFLAVCKVWKHYMANFPQSDSYTLMNCTNVLWHTMYLAEEFEDGKETQCLLQSIRAMYVQSMPHMSTTILDQANDLQCQLENIFAHPEQLRCTEMYQILAKD